MTNCKGYTRHLTSEISSEKVFTVNIQRGFTQWLRRFSQQQTQLVRVLILVLWRDSNTTAAAGLEMCSNDHCVDTRRQIIRQPYYYLREVDIAYRTHIFRRHLEELIINTTQRHRNS